jgi:hypothetical protein
MVNFHLDISWTARTAPRYNTASISLPIATSTVIYYAGSIVAMRNFPINPPDGSLSPTATSVFALLIPYFPHIRLLYNFDKGNQEYASGDYPASGGVVISGTYIATD